MELYYNNLFPTGSSTVKQYNGNISGMAWKTKGPGVAYTSVPSNGYSFEYDKLNRLLKANYASSPTSNGSFNTYIGRYNESLTYDEMGNIKTLARNGMQGVLDNLTYTYLYGGNKLGIVTDLTTDPAGFNDMNKIDYDYTNDTIGNLTRDRNKGLDIAYNILNLPEQVTRTSDNNNIKYVYDATGRKLKKIYNNLTHFYIDGIEYSGDTLLFIATEEGRVRKQGASYIYDYFLKDHLGNVRVVLTAEPPAPRMYPPATMETANSPVEETFYANLPQTRYSKPYGFDSNTGNAMVARVSSSIGMKQVGPSVTLKVNAGDKLSLFVRSFYKTSEANYNRNPLLQEMLTLLLNGLVNPTGVTGQTATKAREIASNQIFGTSSYSGTLSSIAPGTYNTTADGTPKAYMVWTLFDNEFNLVKSSSGMVKIPNTPDTRQDIVKTDIIMERGGYFYAYLVNESSMNVYFDDFQVTHVTGKVLEENHYYPFGLLNAQLSTRPTEKPLNYYKYNGKELQKELNLEWLDYGARFYDAQVGRFLIIDGHSENYISWTTYNYVGNNPLILIDPDGLDWFYHSVDGESDPKWIWHDGDKYNSGVKDNKGNDVILQGQKAVVIFQGSENERLGKGDNLFGEGAKLAKATVYGPDGANDIKEYGAYTMSSNPLKYATVADGEYNVYYDKIGKSGALTSNWAVEGRGRVPARNGINPSFPKRNPAYLDGVFIHRSNKDGYAGGEVSRGCPLIVPSVYDLKGNLISPGWDQFNEQLKGVKKYLMIMKRTKP